MINPPGPTHIHRKTPYIAEYANFLTKPQCKEISKLRKQLTYTQGQLRINGQRQVNLEQRHAFTHKIERNDFPQLIKWVDYVANWLQLPNREWVEIGLFIHYPPGGEFKLHTDVVSSTNSQGNVTNRTATVIVYLNDDYEGGHTVFPNHRVSVKPEVGKALFFRYDYEITPLNDSTIHIGEKVSSDKYILVFFIRDQEYTDDLRAISHY
jgi:prolyl 4-hydroxylase